MSATNKLLQALPYPVETSIHTLGVNLRTARLRRNFTIQAVAQRIGTGPRAVMDAERGKASTSIAVYAALLWLYDHLQPLADLASPETDEQGLVLLASRQRQRARRGGDLDNDF